MSTRSTWCGIRTRLPRAVTAAALVTALTSCGLLGGSDDEGEAPQGGGGNGPEKTTVTIGIMPTTDVAPFHLAMKRGFFEDEGLKVTPVDAKSSDESTGKLIAGDVDIAYSSYPPFFTSEIKGKAKHKGGIKIVADASSAGPGSVVLVALPDSTVKAMEDLPGKRVAVTGPGSVSVLLVKSTLKTNGVDYEDIEWVPTPFPATAAALKAGDVDAAFVTEPFITDAQKNAGAVPIFDAAQGPTADFPTGGWASTGDFTEQNPKTVAAFQRAMQRATELALSDRSLVEPLLVEFSGVDEQTAKIAVLLTFQSKLDASRLQRVPDLMAEFGVIEETIDVNKMIVPTAPLEN